MKTSNLFKTLLFALPLTLSLSACGKGKSKSTSPDDAKSASKSDEDGGSEGSIALDITLPTVDGSETTVAVNSENDLVILSFWATWCKPCIAELKEINEKLYPEYKKRGLHVYGISTDGPESLAKVSGHVAREDYSFPILLDQETEVLSRYNQSGDIPFYVILDHSGEVVHKHQGYVPGDVDKLGEMLDEKLPK